MKFKYCGFLIGIIFCLQFSVSRCSFFGCSAFTATFVALSDQILDDPNALMNDPQMTFFKEDMGLRDDDIQHVFDDAIKFYNETYGLDFSNSPPNEQNEYFFENAKMTPFRLLEDVHYQVIFNNWIQTGNTRTTCRDIQVGGYQVTFTGDQLLHGSYGGDKGTSAVVGNTIQYGYDIIDVCDQSPVIVLFQNTSPLRIEPVDGDLSLNFDIYNNILGYGKALGFSSSKPDPDNPGKYRIIFRFVFTFPAR